MTSARFAARFPDLKGRRVVVVGAGKSGLAAARLARREGAGVLVADARDEGALRVALAGLDVELHAGGHPPELAHAADLVVLSPGVPADVELATAARAAGVPVWGEVELAFRFTRGRIVGVTGSNGKSTVTSWLGAMLREDGIPGGTGGNLDTPLAALLDLDGDDAVHALELSSFQLETIERFRPAVGVLLNLSPDHLDRHASLDAYAEAKARLFENQRDADCAVLNADDVPSRRFFDAARANVHTFSTTAEIERGAYVCDGRVTLRTRFGEERLLAVDELPLPGEHNVSNALAAALAARLAGASPHAIERGLRSFRPLAHRLERVAVVRGVSFFNDSKATNPAATLPALRAFAPGTIHLIVGGKDKGGDWDTLVAEASARTRRVLAIGVHSAETARRFEPACTVLDCGDLASAVARAFEGASEGDVVLLSPACASFDQFSNFEERGVRFREAVAALGESDA